VPITISGYPLPAARAANSRLARAVVEALRRKKTSDLETRGEQSFLVSENESAYIPLGTRHRLENPGKVPLEMIEVQSGAYLGEDDIVRFEDSYGRG
jgi:Mannose-6-phosphate isomerase